MQTHARRMPGKAENIEVSAAVVQRGSVEAQADEPLQDWEQLHKRSVQIGKVFEETLANHTPHLTPHTSHTTPPHLACG